MKGVGVKSRDFLDGRRVISPGNTMFWSAVAQSHAKYFIFIERVRGMRNTSAMGTTKKSLAQTHPALAKEADGWDPSIVLATESKVKRLWKCKLGHNWESRIYDRIKLNSGCQVCGNRIVLPGFNDLETSHPDLAKQAQGWDPKTVHKGVARKFRWKCEKGHEWDALITARVTQNQGCPVCSNKKILAGYNDLATTHPDLAIEADGWDPETISYGSQKKMSWKCVNGHKFLASVGSRSGGNGCPVCSNRKFQEGANDLKTQFPAIAGEADGWDPKKVISGSGEKKSWRCPLGHKFEATVISRTSRGTGCNICAGKKIQTGFNDLATKFPEIAEEAFGWDPKLVSPGTHKKYPWVCQKGHQYEMAPHLRTGSQKQGCSYCVGRSILAGYNDLATTHPSIAKEADGWDPTTISAGSHEVKDWKCSNGHSFRVNPNQRTSRTSNCPTCANLKIEKGFNDLLTLYPDLAAEADGWNPEEIGGGSSKRLSWKCKEKGHVWESSIINRTSNGSNCPVCVGQLVIVGINDLVTTHPEIAKQAIGWDPTTLTAGSKKKRNWLCDKGHNYLAPVVNKTNLNSGCPICANVQVLVGFNDLLTTHPELANQADGWDPTKVVYGSPAKKKWRCGKGHNWIAAISNRSGPQKQGCPICSNLQVLVGYNDLLTTHPELSKEADGWDPRTVVAGTSKKMAWKCNLGHSYSAAVTSRSAESRQSGCPICDGKVVLAGFNDIATTHPQLASEAVDWDPTTVMAGSSRKKLKWKCAEGHIWETHPNSRLAGHGCPSCAATGFDPNKTGWLYFLEHNDWEMFQIGITNSPDNRLARHKKLGWEVLELRGPMDGHLTQNWETSILRMLKAKGADLSNSKIVGKFDGFSEAWSKSTYDAKSIKHLMLATEEFEERRK